MACNCGGNGSNRTTYEVVADGGAGSIIYTSTSKVAADAIANRPTNTGAIVREKAK